MNDRKVRKHARYKNEPVIAFAWYRREEWERLREIAADRDVLEDTYDEWLRSARQTLLSLQAKGRRVQKTNIGVEELLRWCQSRKVAVDGNARAEFAAAILQQQHTDS